METILFLAHTEKDGRLSRTALEVLGLAIEMTKTLREATLSVGLIGAEVQAGANQIAGSGAQKFFAVKGPEFGESRYATDAAACEAIAKASKATIIIAPGSSRTSRCLPGVAQRLNGRIDTHVTGAKADGSHLQIQRWFYRQRIVTTMTRQERPWILLVDAGIFPVPSRDLAGSAAVEQVSVNVTPELARTQVTGVKAPSASTQTIRPDAQLLFVAGAGWTKKQADGQIHTRDAEKLILDFLNSTQASLGSSKSLVDQEGEGGAVLSFLSHLNQIGQTGSTPRHPKGLVTCCHGEEPHAVGWRFVSERRAVNLDPGCGWAQGKADILYVADAFQVMKKVNELLAKS